MELGELISKYRKEMNMTIDELAEKSGVPKGTINKIIGGVTKAPTLENVRAIAYALGKTLNDFDNSPPIISNGPPELSEEAKQIAQDYEKLSDHGKGAVRAILQYEGGGAEKKQEAPVRVHKAVKVIELPHAWDKASAGKGFDLSDSRMDTWKIIYNDDTRRADFCVDVDGSSMEPLYHNGDVLLIRRQPSVDIGEAGLFIVDGLGYVKRQAEDRLESINPEFPDIYPGEYSAVECMGKVIGILQDDWIIQA